MCLSNQNKMFLASMDDNIQYLYFFKLCIVCKYTKLLLQRTKGITVKSLFEMPTQFFSHLYLLDCVIPLPLLRRENGGKGLISERDRDVTKPLDGFL